MTPAELTAALTDPTAYPHPAAPVKVRQTHISLVFLAGDYVYKLKKPVSFGFLDFSTLEKRRHFCEAEVRLNRRLAPHVYLGVVPVTRDGGRLRVDGPGEAVEWAVKMVRLPDGTSLLDRLKRGDLTAGDMTRLAGFLAGFHRTADGGPGVAEYGRFETVAGNARENFAQSGAAVGVTVSAAVFERLRELTDTALTQLRPRIESRAGRGVPRDTHGDLHLDHVYMTADAVFAIDRIEFNDRFRYADPVADLAFLVMDLRFRGRPDLASVLADAYFRAADDEEGRSPLPFYTAYRAVVRAKVEGFELGEPEVPAAAKERAAAKAKAHWLLALGQLEEPNLRPMLVLVGGLPGSGKSTLARGLAATAGFEVVRSDVVRKELAGLPPEARGGAELYSREATDRTYAECLRGAEAALFGGRRVIVDATFRDAARRRAFLDLGDRLCVPAAFVVCEASAETTRQRLEARVGDASDATWDVYREAAAAWEPAPGAVAIRTDGTPDESVRAALAGVTPPAR